MCFCLRVRVGVCPEKMNCSACAWYCAPQLAPPIPLSAVWVSSLPPPTHPGALPPGVHRAAPADEGAAGAAEGADAAAAAAAGGAGAGDDVPRPVPPSPPPRRLWAGVGRGGVGGRAFRNVTRKCFWADLCPAEARGDTRRRVVPLYFFCHKEPKKIGEKVEIKSKCSSKNLVFAHVKNDIMFFFLVPGSFKKKNQNNAQRLYPAMGPQ